MEGLTRLVSESLARHGFDRPLDYRRLRWSRWFRCESHHSLLVVPSQPGVFAVAEEIMDFGHKDNHVATAHVATAASAVPRGQRPAVSSALQSSFRPRRLSAVKPPSTSILKSDCNPEPRRDPNVDPRRDPGQEGTSSGTDPPNYSSMARHRRHASLVPGRSDPLVRPVDRSSNNRSAHAAPPAGLDS
jgi:hypothetical protein